MDAVYTEAKALLNSGFDIGLTIEEIHGTLQREVRKP